MNNKKYKTITIGNRKITDITDDEIHEFLKNNFWFGLGNYKNVTIENKGFNFLENKEIFLIKLSMIDKQHGKKVFEYLKIHSQTLECELGFQIANHTKNLNWFIYKGFEIPFLNESYKEV